MTAKEIIKLLKKSGWKEIRQVGSHLQMKNDKGVLITVPCHNGDLKIGTEKNILKKAGLKK